MPSRVLLIGVCWLLYAAGLASAQPSPPKALVPAQMGQKPDGLGGQWTMDGSGAIRHQQSSARFGQLQVDGNGFNVNSQMMTADGNEYQLTGTIQSVALSRSLKFDYETNTIRCIDAYTNSNPAPVALNVQMMLTVRSSNVQVVTSSGGALGAFGNKDSGFIVPAQRSSSSRGQNSQAVVYYVADARAKQKPGVRMDNGNSAISVNYALNIPSGQTAAVIHGCAIRNLTGSEDAPARKKLFAPFLSKKWVRDVPTEIRKQFVNRGSGGTALDEGKSDSLLADVRQLAEADGVEIDASSVLSMAEDTHLSGNVRGEKIEVSTNFGKATIALDEIAAISGGAGSGRPIRVFLRNGEILSGPVSGEMVFEESAGLEVTLTASQMQDLFLPMAVKPPSATAPTVFLESRDGNRVVISPDVKFLAATAWGRLELSADNVSFLYPVRDPQPIHQVVFKDKSRLTVILQGTEFTATSQRFGPLKMATGEIVKLVTLAPPVVQDENSADEEESMEDQWTLTGENVLVGELESKQLRLRTAGGETNVEMRQVLSIEQAAEGDSNFTVELAGGNQLEGTLLEPVWRIKSQNKVWSIPARHVVGYQGRAAALDGKPVTDVSKRTPSARQAVPAFSPAPLPAPFDPSQ